MNRFLAALAVLALIVHPVWAQDTLAQIKQKGVLVVGVRLEKVPVTAVTRMAFLRQGRIDMILATLGDTPDRPNILSPKSEHLTSWAALKGKKICAVQGAYYNRRVSQLYGPDLVVFPAVPDALSALQGGNCIGFLFDDTLIVSTLSANDPRWAGYEMALPSEDSQPWAIGVRLEDLTSPFGVLLHDMSVDWHKTGLLVDEEHKWGIAPSPFLQEMRKKFAAGDCYHNGSGHLRDYTRSAQLYTLAGQRGIVVAFCALGNQYLAGRA